MSKPVLVLGRSTWATKLSIKGKPGMEKPNDYQQSRSNGTLRPLAYCSACYRLRGKAPRKGGPSCVDQVPSGSLTTLPSEGQRDRVSLSDYSPI